MDSNKTDKIRSIAFEFSREGMVITDASQPDNPIIDANPAFEEMTGYRKHEIIGKNCRFLQGDDTDNVAVAELREAIRDKRHTRVKLRNYRKDGTLFWNELSISPIVIDGRPGPYFVGIQTDITAQVAAEEQKHNEHRRLREHAEALQIQSAQQKSLDSRIEEVLLQAYRYTS